MLQLIPTNAFAQAQPSAALVTIGPGDLSYERFGHNMLHIRDPDRGIDVVFNWGIFDFGDDFIFNFIQGRLWYWMAEDFRGPDAAIDYYTSLDRSVWVQELNLSPQQVRLMLDQCMQDLAMLGRPGKGYRYDYYRDNCSTRTRDAIDRAMGGQIKSTATTMPSDSTYRSETRRLMAGDLPLYLGLNYVLGHPTDMKLSAWEEMFIPMRMRERFNALSITDESGHILPLVKRERVVHTSGHIAARARAPRWEGWFFLAGAAVAGVMIWLSRLGSTWSRRGFGSLAALVGLLIGMGGLILAYLWLITDHAASRPNENILQLGPWSLPLAVLVPMALGKRVWALKGARWIAVLGLGLSMLGWMMQVLPIMDQCNGEIIALAMPLHAGLVWALWTTHGPRAVVPAAERSST